MISLNVDKIKIGNLEKILNFKFSFGIQEFKINKLLTPKYLIKLLNAVFERNYSDFLFCVLDLINKEDYNNVDKIIKI